MCVLSMSSNLILGCPCMLYWDVRACCIGMSVHVVLGCPCMLYWDVRACFYPASCCVGYSDVDIVKRFLC